MSTHELKTWPAYYHAVIVGVKTFECRKNDRDFRVGDCLLLREYYPNEGSYSGRECRKVITYILDAALSPTGYCIMSIK